MELVPMILRPRPSKSDNDFARHTRLELRPGAVTVRSRSGAREITGVAVVVRMPSSDGRPLGSIQLRSSDGTVLLELDTAEWTHGLRAGARFVQPLDPPASPATYLPNLIAETLGVEIRKAEDARPQQEDARPRQPDVVLRPAGAPMPLLVWAYVLGIAGVLALILAIFIYAVSVVAGQIAMLIVAASTVVAAAFVAITWYRWSVPPVRSWQLDDAFRPHSAVPVQRAFAARARIARMGDEVVLVGADGTGTWLGGPDEPFGVHRIVLTGATVDLMTMDGIVLARLPRAEWLDASGGLAALTGFCARNGIVLDTKTEAAPAGGAPDVPALEPRVSNVVAVALLSIPSAAPAILIVALALGGTRAIWPVTVGIAAAAAILAVVSSVVALVHGLRLRRRS